MNYFVIDTAGDGDLKHFTLRTRYIFRGGRGMRSPLVRLG
jgi:hypothetical protein